MDDSNHSALAGPSYTDGQEGLMTVRQREKSPARKSNSLDEVVRLDEAGLDQEIDLLIGQYIESKGDTFLSSIWQEQVLGRIQDGKRKDQIEDVERAILDGDYGSLESLIAQPGLLRPQTQKAFLYLCWRQQFLEHVENRESQKAFNLLQKRLKPLEHYQPVPYDFYSLSYLTSASTVHDAPTFRDWAGVGPERDRLVGMWRELMDSERAEGGKNRYLPPDRLRTLLRQAAAWQVCQTSSSTEQRPTRVPTLLQDYSPLVIPQRLLFLVQGHSANVKTVDLIGPGGHLGASGASDSTLRIFSTEDGSTQCVLTGHTSRIWDCAASFSGTEIASASGDGTVRIWTTQDGNCQKVLHGDGGDVYSVKWRPNHENQLASASYDRILRSWDVETSKQVRTFSGHSQSTLAVAFDQTGNMLASGSKDKHIRLWDAVGGVCIQTFAGCLGEITSVEFDQEGKYLLAGCKDNSNRLWDLRMQRNIYRYTGHQNTSKNLIRCGFAHSSSLIVGGSEDGSVYIWEREGGSTSGTSGTNGISGAGTGSGTGSETNAPTPPGLLLSPNMIPTNTNTTSDARSSPAYYPPRQNKSTSNSSNRQISGGITIKPIKVLDGHDQGSVFDVKYKYGKMISAGEDGKVGIWGQ